MKERSRPVRASSEYGFRSAVDESSPSDDRAIQLSPEGAARKRYKDAQKSAQRASRHEAAQTRQAPPPAPTPAPPRSIPSHTSSARNPRTAPASAYSSTPRYQSARLQIYRPGTSWWDRVAAAVEKEGFKPESGGGVEVALAAWEVCEEGFARLHESVSQVQVAGMLQVTTSDNSPLVAFAGDSLLSLSHGAHNKLTYSITSTQSASSPWTTLST